jgi:hypothetical protein|nr:MAG TPA: hypothetical protein [Caudoviricetes sp.]
MGLPGVYLWYLHHRGYIETSPLGQKNNKLLTLKRNEIMSIKSIIAIIVTVAVAYSCSFIKGKDAAEKAGSQNTTASWCKKNKSICDNI